jgi:hypothetical protein
MAIRCNKLAGNYLAAVHLAAAVTFWLWTSLDPNLAYTQLTFM